MKNKFSFNKLKYKISFEKAKTSFLFKNTAKLKYFIVPLMLFSLVFVGALCEEESSRRSKDRDKEEEEEEEKEDDDYLNYKSDKWGFEIKYPKDWEFNKDEGQGGFLVSFVTPSEGQDDPRENVTFTVYPALEEDFDTLIAEFTDDLTVQGATLSGYSKTTISGYPAYKAEYSYQDPSYGKFIFVHYFINAGQNWYEFLYLSLDSTYSQYLAQVEKILKSIVIK